jgi:biofilm PGA synthesis lipoprotein PgaB
MPMWSTYKLRQISLLLIIHLIFTVPVYSGQLSQRAVPAGNSAVILMYHNVSDEAHPSTSVTPSIFKQHMQYLADNEFVVWPLFKTLVYLATGKPVPPKTVVLTFDDAYRSVYSEAFPVLKQKAWPFTVFVTTKYIAEGYSHYMSWQQLREIQEFGGDIGNHSLSHPHMVRQYKEETDEQWRLRLTNEVDQAQHILRQHVSKPIWAFAYPYGEYSQKVRDLLRHLGYFGLGQHSGAVSQTSDFQAVPRFPMSTNFSGLEDFAIKVATKNLPVTVLSPDDGIVASDTDIPVLTMRLDEGDYKSTAMACYASGQGRIQVECLENKVVEVRANQAIKPGRTKYNCTAASKTEPDVFYWFSFLWMKPEADGRWYAE